MAEPDNDNTLDDLVALYCQTKRIQYADRILERLMPNIKYLADSTFQTVPSSSRTVLSQADLQQIGCLAAFQSLKTFEIERGFKFWTYAQSRVKGSMLDALRRVSSTSRTRNLQFVPLESVADTSFDLSILLEPSISDLGSNVLSEFSEEDQSLLLLLICGFNVRTIGRLLDRKVNEVNDRREIMVQEYTKRIRYHLNSEA